VGRLFAVACIGSRWLVARRGRLFAVTLRRRFRSVVGRGGRLLIGRGWRFLVGRGWRFLVRRGWRFARGIGGILGRVRLVFWVVVMRFGGVISLWGFVGGGEGLLDR
jgi:hypothetical protein